MGVMIPDRGLLGILARGGGAAGLAGAATTAGAKLPLYGILGMLAVNRYAKYAVPDSEPGYEVKARLMHSDDDMEQAWYEKIGLLGPTFRHYQFIGDNGRNKGFGTEGEFTDPPWFLPEYTLGNPFGSVRYDARIVDKGMAERQKAIEAIRDMKRENPDLYGELDDADLRDYEVLMNNCHDYIPDVLWRGAGFSGR